MKARIVFSVGISLFFIGVVIATYIYGVVIPKTGISTRVLGFVVDTIEGIGYFGVFVLMVLESCGIPIPSEIIMPFSGFLVHKGVFDFWLVVLVGSLANLVGSILAYIIGLKGRDFLNKYGKYLFIHKHHLEYAENLFYRYGSAIVFLGRNMPVVRTYISFPAGISKMNFVKFSILTFVGSIPWNMFLVYIGIILGEHWDMVVEFFEKLDTIIIICLVLILLYLLKVEAKSASQ